MVTEKEARQIFEDVKRLLEQIDISSQPWKKSATIHHQRERRADELLRREWTPEEWDKLPKAPPLRTGLLLQEIYADDPWKLLVCCMLLNQTNRRAVDRLIEDGFFRRYPYPTAMSQSPVELLVEKLRPLGLQNTRARKLQTFSRGWTIALRSSRENGERWPTAGVVAGLAGVGPYALDSYRFFVLGDTSRFESGDKELKRWLETSSGTNG
jgi:endonuclease III